jgi:hypothetical protein
MTDRRKAFLERHPDVSEDELIELFARERRSLRMTAVFVVVLLLTLVATGAAAWRVHHVVQNDAQEIAAEIADEQIIEVEKVLGARMKSGRELSRRVFTFVIDVAQNNQLVRDVTTEWRALGHRTSTLRADVATLRQAPVESSKRIVRGVPELIDALVKFVTGLLDTLDRLGPQFARALTGASDAMLSGDDIDITSLLDALEVALDPLIGDNAAQRLTWQTLRAELVAWGVGLQADVAELRERIDDERLSREFAVRFVDAVLGRR